MSFFGGKVFIVVFTVILSFLIFSIGIQSAVAGEERPVFASIVTSLGQALLAAGQTEQAIARLSWSVEIHVRRGDEELRFTLTPASRD